MAWGNSLPTENGNYLLIYLVLIALWSIIRWELVLKLSHLTVRWPLTIQHTTSLERRKHQHNTAPLYPEYSDTWHAAYYHSCATDGLCCRTGAVPPGTTKDQLIYAKKLFESSFHPDSGELQNVIGRMSCQVPGGMLITGAMLQWYRWVVALFLLFSLSPSLFLSDSISLVLFLSPGMDLKFILCHRKRNYE